MSLFNIRNNKKKLCLLLIFFSIAFSLIISQISNSTILLSNDIAGINNKGKSPFENNLSIANDDSILYEGNEISLNITDYGNLYDVNQEVIVTNQEEVNVSYYLDAEHDWKSSKIDVSTNNIYDTREWINDSDFFEVNIPFRKYQFFSNIMANPPEHNYSANLDFGTDIENIITEAGAIAMRVHFSTINLEDNYDAVFVLDEYDQVWFAESGNKSDFYSPWILGDTLQISIGSDGLIELYGYDIDYYEFYNASNNYYDYQSTWEYNGNIIIQNFGPGSIGGENAMYVELPGEPDTSGGLSATYLEGAYVELYQNITILRSSVIDAYINFDYYAEFAMGTNENFIYFEINNEKIYSLGLRDIVEAGRKTWHNTGDINIDLWVNKTNIFDEICGNNEINISIGIMSGGWITYSRFEEMFQQVFWFDNVSLVLTTLANSTQEDISLRINNNTLVDDSNKLGCSNLSIYDLWEDNPIALTFNTTSPFLAIIINTTIYAFHNATSKINQQNMDGLNTQILKNCSVYWEFYHNLYMPGQYEDFEFIIDKPINWIILAVLDPTFQPRSFEKGDVGDEILKINISQAIYPGWWSFKATSPNYYNITNIKILKSGNWLEDALFESGESTQIKSIVQYDNETPPNINYTLANLKIYDPDGNMWYNNSLAPELTGEVIFAIPKFTSEDTLGGEYTYALIWSNGTAIGGISSSFIIIHESKLELEKPEEAEEDLIIEGFLGDIIPLRVYLFDDENDLPISGASVYYEGHDGDNEYLEESSPGIYETTIDTDDYKSAGSYDIEITTSKIGFSSSELEIKLVLAEESNLFFWIIIAILLSVVSVLSVLSVRSYVILPRKRRKELELIAKTQRFKDLQNIQAVVVIEKTGGIPVYMKSYSILETQNKDLFSGFIQAIITIGDEISGKKAIIIEEAKPDKIDKLVELDFKHFNCLIADKDPIRLVFILKESASERLKNLVIDLLCNIYSDHSTLFRSWDGSLDKFEILIPPILNKYFELFYKEEFKLTGPAELVAIRKENELNVMELRILNVIRSFAKNKSEFYLETILQLVAEKNKDLIIEGIESLINRKVIIPENP